MEVTSYSRTFLYVISRRGCSAGRTRAAMNAAARRWPEGRWVSGRQCLNFTMPDGSVGMSVSWRERSRKPAWVNTGWPYPPECFTS